MEGIVKCACQCLSLFKDPECPVKHDGFSDTNDNTDSGSNAIPHDDGQLNFFDKLKE